MPTGRSGPADDAAGTDRARQGRPSRPVDVGRTGHPLWTTTACRSTWQHRSGPRRAENPMPDPDPADDATPEVQARIRASFERQGLMRYLGAARAHVGPGRVDIVLPHRAELTQQHGYFHAGATTAVTAPAATRLRRFPRGHGGAHGGVQGQPPRPRLRRPARGVRNGPQVRADARSAGSRCTRARPPNGFSSPPVSRRSSASRPDRYQQPLKPPLNGQPRNAQAGYGSTGTPVVRQAVAPTFRTS